MPFRRAPADEVVDGEVVGQTAPPEVFQNNYAGRNVINLQVPVPSPSELSVIEQRARAISVFVKIPFFCLLALNGKVPLTFRLGAAVLGLLEAAQLARDHGYDYTNQEW